MYSKKFKKSADFAVHFNGFLSKKLDKHIENFYNTHIIF